MKTHIRIKKRGARLAILLTLLVIAPIGAKNCWGQVAGFAQSRSENAATAESGPRRFLSNLNPFRQNDDRDREQPRPLVAPAISQPVVTASRASTPSSAPNPSPTPTPSASGSAPRAVPSTAQPDADQAKKPVARLAMIRPHVSPSPGGAASLTKKSSTSGVASILLDELEEEELSTPPVSAAPTRDRSSEKSASAGSATQKVVRRSLRAESFPSSLELLDPDEEAIDDNSESSAAASSAPALAFEADDALDVSVSDEAETTPTLAIEEEAPTALVEVAKKPAKAQLEPETLSEDADASVLVAPKSAGATDQSPELDAPPNELDAPLKSIDSRLDEVLAPRERVERDPQGSANAASNVSVATTRAPNVLVNTIGPKKLVVGQESTYRVVARNLGTETARKLVVTTDIPESVANVKARAAIGEASFQSSVEKGTSKRCVWNVGDLAPGGEFALEIKLTPTKRTAFGLASQFDFERASALAEVEVQEPILETLIEGRDSIEWGVEDKYRLRLRNIGNGDAEDVVLNVSTGENSASQKIGLLRAGDEKIVEMSVKTATDDYFVISAEAVGAYGLRATAEKKVLALRGRLDVQIETPDLQFVDGEFEATIRVKNLGAATLENVDVVAQIPQDVEVLYCSNQARRNLEKRRVYWVAPFIRPNEETVFTARCRVTKSGVADFEVVGVDQTGLIAQARSQVNVEAIAVLAMHINAPKEPIAVGKTCTYELVVENNGTRDAREVNSGIFLGDGVKPLAVEDNQGYVYPEDSKVLFKKIESLKAGERVVFRVKAEAVVAGNQKVQAMVQSTPEDVSLLSEETTYCYSRRALDSRGTSFSEAERMTAEKETDALRK